MSALGTLIGGRYRLDAVIGRGGMSTVYKAFDTVLERPVAIKLMHREIATDSDQLERFRREARAVAQLNHPHVVSVIDAGEEPLGEDARRSGTPYIVLEYVDGETLKSVIRRDGPLEIPQALAYSIEIARALGAAHERQIVHRDVKPHNILIDPEGGAKITDFGIARSLTEEGLTMAGRVLGTTDYVSPEQALGQPVTPQSDLYSLGIVLYEMLTGDVPFHGETPVAVAMKHVREDVPDVQARRPELSAATASVLDRALAKDLSRALPRRRRDGRRPRTGAGDRGVAHRPDDRRGDDRAAHAARPGAPAAALADAPPGALAGLAGAARRDRRGRARAGARQRAPRDRRRAAAPPRRAASPVSLSQPRPPTATTRSGPDRKTATRSRTSSTATPRRPGAPRPTTKGTCARRAARASAIYLDAAPGRRGARDRRSRRRRPASRRSSTPPTTSTPRCPTATPTPLAARGWKGPIGASQSRAQRPADPAAPAAGAHRYYLLWMTTLPPGSQSATISDITLFR